MGLKYRSKIDFASILNGDKEGFNLGIDGSLFLREEATPRVFNPPRIGTQGISEGAASAVTDISIGTDNKLKISVDGGAIVDVTVDESLGSTGDLIASELETKINAALLAAAQDARVWVYYDNSDDHYEVYSQLTGESSSVVITDGASDNVADDLKLGVANGGTETAGENDQDFLLYTTGGPTFEQPVESNPHRSQRFHVGIIKQKKVVNFDIDTLLNMSGSAGDSLDTALRLLLKSAFGKETVTAGVSIKYEQDIPNTFFTMVRASTIFAEYYTGCYCKDYTITAPGDAPVTMKFVGMGSNCSIAGIGKSTTGATASQDVVLDNVTYKHIERFSVNARVMVVGADGRTITDGYSGNLYVTGVNLNTDTLSLSSAVDVEAGGFIVFWHPGAVQQTGRDNVYTDLEGSFKFNLTDPEVCCTNINLNLVNDHIDRNNCFGTDVNQGFIAGNRLTATLEATLDLSNDNLGNLVQAREFGGFRPQLIIGDTSGRHLEIYAPKWVVSVPAIDLPENGSTSEPFTGNLFQSEAGAKDPFYFEFK